ncbi:hypothetical protein GCM10011351_12800 [Paraliobacillus quinghaiensis]|uniref:Uncharacterized protein n=1 Tax=Paraliobacillus quinghaiensis TaxID=470815 RepID=A0A917TLT4_9BACI|nr:hypothetical protein [Paraliobacillus quinghaiensis]GGM28319.1 hypothetical protein GCM10011351_12800 [Paraliobacillus quinghaiensis]
MKINNERLWKRIHELGSIGQDPEGSLTRLVFTNEERQAKQLVKFQVLRPF